MKATADSSIQSGQNWLSVDSGRAGYNGGTQKVVAGFSRDITGNINFSTVNIDVTSIQLYDKALTGSAATSAKVTASKALIAETGGINAMIVDATALPEQVADDVVASAFRR